ncbi:hypothetical protein [Bacillus cereus group sp. BfR-BA-01352]|uniref:hypothetical protein n=1 Tax=Bacillus cereus group sp. BfR-BA-01352 TaxID=2920315 RepID=UPI001F55E2D1|nr:hypothetical protein [Bacillus cereus group sp. BfR-BA-01352]
MPSLIRKCLLEVMFLTVLEEQIIMESILENERKMILSKKKSYLLVKPDVI